MRKPPCREQPVRSARRGFSIWSDPAGEPGNWNRVLLTCCLQLHYSTPNSHYSGTISVLFGYKLKIFLFFCFFFENFPLQAKKSSARHRCAGRSTGQTSLVLFAPSSKNANLPPNGACPPAQLISASECVGLFRRKTAKEILLFGLLSNSPWGPTGKSSRYRSTGSRIVKFSHSKSGE